MNRPTPLTLRAFAEQYLGQPLQPYQVELLERLTGPAPTENDEMTIETHPHAPKSGREHAELKDALEKTPGAPTMRATRYVYHVSGHAKLHDPNPAHHTHTGHANGPVVPFEVVIRRALAIDSDTAMEETRHEVRDHIVQQLKVQDSPYIVGDAMIRNVSKLHRILVDAHDPGGPAARIMS